MQREQAWTRGRTPGLAKEEDQHGAGAAEPNRSNHHGYREFY